MSALLALLAGLVWFGTFVGVAFFGYMPPRFVIGFAFVLAAVWSFERAAHYVLKDSD